MLGSELLPFTWEAAATLFTGFAAVGAAWRVGHNQLLLLNRQTEISENDLKMQLFERRVRCVERMRNLYTTWSMQGRVSPEQLPEFKSLLFDVELLFPKGTISQIELAYMKSSDVEYQYNRSRYYADCGNEEKRKEFLEKAFASEDQLNEVMPVVLEDLKAHTRLDFWDA